MTPSLSVLAKIVKTSSTVLMLSLCFCSHTLAQSSEMSLPVLSDRNGDQIVNIDAFGDSITRGVGDFTPSGEFVEAVSTPNGEAGYPLRIEELLGIPVRNLGRPGERELESAVSRFVAVVLGGGADIAVISGGSNDAFFRTSAGEISRTYQTILNIARVSGIQAVVATLPPTCCDRADLDPFVKEYNQAIRERAFVNDVPLADISRAYTNTCIRTRCSLLNLPEGLHPNRDGYSVSGEAVAAALLELDLFTPMGQADLAGALNIDPSSIRTTPDAAPIADSGSEN